MSDQAERRSRDCLDSLFQGQQRAVFAFSGGKNSLVVADLCRPYKDRIGLPPLTGSKCFRLSPDVR